MAGTVIHVPRDLAVLVPGQGSHQPDDRSVVERLAPDLLARCIDLVGCDPFPRADESTRFAQPAIFCTGLARWRAAGDKVLDPKTRRVETFPGGDKQPLFDEPAGLSFAAGKLYVADTNAHRIRVVDLATNAVTTLALSGVEPPPPQKEWLPPETQ